jgi:hypothetical protein
MRWKWVGIAALSPGTKDPNEIVTPVAKWSRSFRLILRPEGRELETRRSPQSLRCTVPSALIRRATADGTSALPAARGSVVIWALPCWSFSLNKLGPRAFGRGYFTSALRACSPLTAH